MTGPRKRPTKLKILLGNPGHQKINQNEPEPRLGAPGPPIWLDADARDCWWKIVPELDRLGLLTLIDGGALEGACVAYSRAVAAGRILDAEGLTMEIGPTHYKQQRPEVSIEQKSWSQFRMFCQEFGLTPAARTRLSVSPKQDRKHGADLLDGEWGAQGMAG